MSTVHNEETVKALVNLKRGALNAHIELNNSVGNHTYLTVLRLGDYHANIDEKFSLAKVPVGTLLHDPLVLKVGLKAALLDTTGEDHVEARMSFNGVSQVVFIPWGWIVSVAGDDMGWGYSTLPGYEQAPHSDTNTPATPRGVGGHLKAVK